MILCLFRLKNLAKSEPADLQSLPCLPLPCLGDRGQCHHGVTKGQNFTEGGETAANRNSPQGDFAMERSCQGQAG